MPESNNERKQSNHQKNKERKAHEATSPFKVVNFLELVGEAMGAEKLPSRPKPVSAPEAGPFRRKLRWRRERRAVVWIGPTAKRG